MKFVGLPDTHGIFGDEQAIECGYAFLSRYRPQLVFCLGDVVDFYQLSRFDQSPERALDLQSDIDAAHKFLKGVRRYAKNAKIHLIAGNHEDRLRRWLWTKGAAAISLRSMKVPVLLGLGELGIRYHEDGLVRFGHLLVKHGTVVRAHAAYSARAELEREGVSGMSGHTHRIGEYSVTNRGGFRKWVEAGCLCRLDPEYMPGTIPNWQQGLAYGAFAESGRFSLHTAHVIRGKTMLGDRVVAAQ